MPSLLPTSTKGLDKTDCISTENSSKFDILCSICSIFAHMLHKYIAHYKTTIRLGLPIVVGQIGVIVLGFADTMMVGHYNTPSLAAASFVNNLFNLVTIMLMGFSYGITPLIGALFSRNEYARAGETMKNALTANALFGILLIAVMTVLYFNVDHLGQPTELLPLIRPYFIVILISMAFVVLFNVMRQFTDGIMQTSVAMWILLGGNAFNIVFNYFLIYGKLGFPELGLLGAGISTLASRVLMAACFAFILFTRKQYRPFVEGFKSSTVSWRGTWRVARISFPISLQMGMETGSFTVSAIFVGWLGAIELAAYQVMVSISTLGFMFYYSIGSAVAIRISAFAGKGDTCGIRHAAYAGYHILLCLAVLATLVFYLLARPLISCFTTDPTVVALAVTLIPPLILYQFGDATQICFANALRGTSHVMPMMWIAFVSYIAIGIPLSYILGFPAGLGESGIFFSFSAGLFTAAILFYVEFRKVLSQQKPAAPCPGTKAQA